MIAKNKVVSLNYCLKDTQGEELEKNTKQMESFKGEDAEVIPERNKMEKEESGKE